MHGLLYKISDEGSDANAEKYVYVYRLLHLKACKSSSRKADPLCLLQWPC